MADTQPVGGYRINDDGSADIMLIQKQKEKKEALAKVFKELDALEQAEESKVFSSEGSPVDRGTAFDFKGDMDTPSGATVQPEPDDDISFLEFLKQVGVGGALDAAEKAGELVASEGQRLRDTTLEDVARNLQGVAGGLTSPELSEAGHLQPLPEGAFGNVGKVTVQQALDSLKMGGKIPFHIPQLEAKGGTGTKMARGVASFLYGFTVLRTAGSASMPAGIAADILTTPGEENLANMFNELAPELKNPITDFLAAKEDDSVLTQRLKQAGIGSAAAQALVSTARMMKAGGIQMADFAKPKKVIKRLRSKKINLGEMEGPLPGANPASVVSIRGSAFDLEDFEPFLKRVNSGKAVQEAIKDAQEYIERGLTQPDGRKMRHRMEAVKEARERLKKDPIGETRRVLELDPSKSIDDVAPLIMELVFSAHMLRSKELAQRLLDQGMYQSGVFLKTHALSSSMAEQRKQLSEAAARVLGIRNALSGLEFEEGLRFGKVVSETVAELPPGVSEGELIKHYVLLNEVALKKSYEMAGRPGMKDFILKFMYFNLLSGGDTQIANIIGGMLGVTFNLAARKVGEQVRGGLRFMGSNAKGVQDGESAALTFGLLNGLRRLFPAFAKNMWNAARGRDISVDDVTKLEGMGSKPSLMNAKTFDQFFPGERSNFFKATVDQLGAPFEFPGRGLMSLDNLIQGSSFDAAMFAVAIRRAMEDGLSGKAMQSRIDFYLKHPTPIMIEESTKFARGNVFLDELGPFATHLTKGLDGTFWGRILIPFVKVLVNLAKFPVQNGPLGLTTPKQFNAVFNGTAVERDIAFGQMITGTAISLAGISFALGGSINGTFGANRSTQAAQRRLNKTPCSFRVHNKDGSVRDIAFNNIAPAGAYFCAAADFTRIAGELKAGEDVKLAEEFMNSTRKILLNATFAQNIIQIGNALEDGDPRVLENLVSSLIPASNIVADFQRNGVPFYSEGDNKLRDVRGVNPNKFTGKPGGQVFEPFYEGFYRAANRIRSRIPGLSDSLPERHNLWGEEIIIEGGLGPDLISPIYTSTEHESPIDDLIVDNDIELNSIQQIYMGVRLNPVEHQEFIERAGKPAKAFLESLYEADKNGNVKGFFDQLSGGPTGGIAQKIKATVLAFRENAWTAMLKEEKHHDLLRRNLRVQLEKKDAQHPAKHDPIDVEMIINKYAPKRNSR